MRFWACISPPGHQGAAERIELVGKQQELESRCCFGERLCTYNTTVKTFKTSRERMKAPV